MELLAPRSSDVLGSVWLATALMTYDATHREVRPPALLNVAFRQADIVQLASRLCSKTIHQPRVSQWANGDHDGSTTNYLRAVGSARRISSVDDFEGERTVPWELHPNDVFVASWAEPKNTLTFGELVQWVVSVYSDWALVFPEAANTKSPTREAAKAAIKPRAQTSLPPVPKDGFSLESSMGLIHFEHAPLRFEGDSFSDVFANLQPSILLASILEKPRYALLAAEVHQRFPDRLSRPLGPFLAERKAEGDMIYSKFLNAWGDRTYRRFRLDAHRVASARGIYAFVVGKMLRYIGRSRDPFSKRIQQGYGYIAPRACFSDGQSTNCRVNSLVTVAWPDVAFFVHVEEDEERLVFLEKELIARYLPDWNVMGLG
jgi:hypothetical protein